MALPKINTSTYELIVPSTKQKLKYRPFLVKEEKILLTAMQGKDFGEILNATKTVIENCIISDNIKFNELAMFDIEYLFLQLRIHSVGSEVTVYFSERDENVTDCKTCLAPRKVTIDLKQVTLDFTENVDKNITLDEKENIGIVMKYPNADIITEFKNIGDEPAVDSLFNIVWACIDHIYDKDSVVKAKDISIEEGIEWLGNLNNQQFDKIEKFFENLPKLRHTVDIGCEECGHKEEYTLEGLESFFV